MAATTEQKATLAPNFNLEIQGLKMKSNLTQFIERVEYESAEGVIDMLKLSVLNPDFLFSEQKLFLPGHELALWIGYGPELKWVGRAVIVNSKGNFPLDGMPTMDIVAYSYSHYMQEVRPDPDPPPDVKPHGGKGEEAKKTNWKQERLSNVVTMIAAKWMLIPDVDPTEEPLSNIYQPKEMSDFDMIKGMANLTGYYFWVDGDEKGEWTLHFKHPDNIVQDRKIKLLYSQSGGTLFNFETEILFKDTFTKIGLQQILSSGEMVVTSFVADKKLGWPPIATDINEPAEGSLGTAQEVNMYIGEYSFRVYDGSRFKSLAALEYWGKQWFDKNKRNFVSGAGECVGIPDLRARQTHEISGLGTMFDGDWVLNKVRHIFDAGSGYTCEIDARKAIK